MALTVGSTMTHSTQPTPDAIKNYDYTWLSYVVETGILPNRPNPNIPDQMHSLSPPEGKEKRIVEVKFFWMLFNLFWVQEFIYYACFLTFAGACASWYFARRYNTGPHRGHKIRGKEPDQLSKWPLTLAGYRVIRFHLGTVAVTSMIIAIIKTLRAIALYIEQQVSGENPNKLQKAIFCLIHYCLACVECCCDKVNKNALIWCAIFGSPFCTSACSSFKFIMANLIRTAALEGVTKIIYAMGEFTVGIGCAAFTFLYLGYVPPYPDYITSPYIPTVLAFLIGFFVARVFFGIFDSIVDTIFLCFLIDSKENKAGNMRASKGLQKLVGKYKSSSDEKGKKHVERQQTRADVKKTGCCGGSKSSDKDDRVG